MINASPNVPRPREKEMIPKPLLRLMLGLVLASLALTSYAVYTGRPHLGQPVEGTVIAERQLIIRSSGAKAVSILDTDGTLLQHMDHGGFIAVIANGLDRQRTVARVPFDMPVTLSRRANGRLTVTDPETGWSAELTVFGSDNEAAFAALLPAK